MKRLSSPPIEEHEMGHQRRRTRTGRRVEIAAVVAVVALTIGVFLEMVPLAIGAFLGAVAITADLLIQ